LAVVSPEFDLERSITEDCIPKQRGFPTGLPSFIYYFIPGTGFGSVTKAPASADPSVHLRTSDGIGLNMGCPVRLARALRVLFLLAPEDRGEPMSKLKSRENHLACVEELLWLTHWNGQAELTRGGELVKAKAGNKAKDVDWFFFSEQLPIFLEAKFRPMDWMRQCDQDNGQLRRSFFDDIGGKFPKERPLIHRCVAGITGYAEPDEQFRAACQKKLLSTPGLSAILYRSLLGPIYVCSLNWTVMHELARRVREPGPHEYPLGYPILFSRQLQQARRRPIEAKDPPQNNVLSVAAVPEPVPTFRPQYPHRFKQPSWTAEGQPIYEHVPAFLPRSGS
jgi:hypothetical protein